MSKLEVDFFTRVIVLIIPSDDFFEGNNDQTVGEIPPSAQGDGAREDDQRTHPRKGAAAIPSTETRSTSPFVFQSFVWSRLTNSQMMDYAMAGIEDTIGRIGTFKVRER